jgi:CRISPR system Cascade subunit CasA
MFDLLSDPLTEINDVKGGQRRLSLPQLYEALAADAVAAFPALRPHQRHAWHALLCQLGALACLKAGFDTPPPNAAGWREALRALTPDYPDDEPWHLVSDPAKPAFLQPPVGKDLAGFKPVATPDQLDMLVTSKNHDVKGARIAAADAEHWLLALVTLQTMEGFLGAGNYGVSRMNGGFANRPGFTLAPPGGIGAHIMRDLAALIEMRERVLNDHLDFDEDGLALVWLKPWDGSSSLSPKELDPYYVEVCRRVRLIEHDGRIFALAAGSKAPRIAFGKSANGLTGDPWTPVETDKDGSKALTIDARGFAYKRLSAILFEEAAFKPALLQQRLPGDANASHILICRALARGQGKTEGLHERRLLISPKVLMSGWRSAELEPLGRLSQTRIGHVGEVSKALRFGLMVLFQNGPGRSDFKPRDPSSDKRARLFMERFEAEVDRDFFERLFEEFEQDDEAGQLKARIGWLTDLRVRALDALRAADAGAPTSTVRHYRAWVRAEGAFLGAFTKAFRDPYFSKDDSDAAA